MKKAVNETINQERRDIKDSVIQHVADLDLVINNADTATTNQLRQGLKILSQGQKKIIKRLVQL